MGNHLGDPFGEFLPQRRTVTQSVDRTINGENIDFWYDYTQHLIGLANNLVEARDEVTRIAIERKANDAGLRAVIRAALAEIRKHNPNHPLLDKKNRDRLFHEFEKEELQRIISKNKGKMWDPRLRPAENQSE